MIKDNEIFKGQNQEYEYNGLRLNGFLALLLFVIVIPALIVGFSIYNGEENFIPSLVVGIPLGLISVICWGGFFVQEPNEARVMIFFGKYRGTCHLTGFYWINPFMTVRKISLRIQNMNIDPIKVNDKIGNPVLIGMVMVWKVSDTYRVVFDLDSKSLGANGAINNMALDHFVRIQSDAALREVTGHFSYDQTEVEGSEVTLRDGGDVISELLEKKINDRLSMAGISVVEARLNYLAYAPEIAAVMLRRQQASAIIMAREKIVEGAVSMVEMALSRLESNSNVKLTDEQKARTISNLLVVLCADEPVVPTVSTAD